MMVALSASPELHYVLVCASGAAALIHELWFIAKQNSAPTPLRESIHLLEKYSKALLMVLVRTAIPLRANLLMPAVYRVKGMHAMLRGGCARSCSAASSMQKALKYAREYNLAQDEREISMLQARFFNKNVVVTV